MRPISSMVSCLLDLVQTYWQLYLKELLRLLIGLRLLKLWHLIYPMLLKEFGMLVSFKLKLYGISDQVFGLISSFLNKRQLHVALDRKFMQEYSVVAGVLYQGSILDPTPTLFLLYIKVCGIGAKLVSNSAQNMLYIKSWQILCRKMISMLTGLKVSSLACKSVLYRPEHAKGDPMKLNFKGLEMQK